MSKSTDKVLDRTGTPPADFVTIQNAEIEAINERRDRQGRSRIPQIRRDQKVTIDDLPIQDISGLALSGGGIRSAAISLGVLQALNQHDALKNIDYLSTVSGGGYMGSSLSATMTATKGDFVFASESADSSKQRPKASEVKDTESVGHIRNYSNYLIPSGLRDVITAAAIVTRGLVANFALVFPVVLFSAAVTVWSNPFRSSLYVTDFFGTETLTFGGINLVQIFRVKYFGITLLITLLGVGFFLFWALYRSIFCRRNPSEFRTNFPVVGALWLIVVALAFFVELQPFVVAGMFDIAEGGGVYSFLTRWVTTLAAIATPIAALVTIFRQQIGSTIKSADSTSSVWKKILGLGSEASVWIAGAAVPLLIWVVYLYLSYWGIINDRTKPPLQVAKEKGNITQLQSEKSGTQSETVQQSKPAAQEPRLLSRPCVYQEPPKKESPSDQNEKPVYDGSHTPNWLLTASEYVSNGIYGCTVRRPMALLYFYACIWLWFVSLFLTTNANSLHRLYRDRLSKAFLFNPRAYMTPRTAKNAKSSDQGRDFLPLDKMRLSEVSTADGPYHLVNASLNIQGSDYANRRGRNADFFLFSPCFVGSRATGYAPTMAMERECPELDLATAMAISGAAVSSNMGSQSIRPLTATLALLNFRLGYWLKNPKVVLKILPNWSLKNAVRRLFVGFLWSEITGRLYENSREIYLTDGGHIENLGIYELLRRRCKLIVVVDADCDSEMHFASLITLQRYARIDLGIRIDLPLNILRETTLANMSTPTIMERLSKPSQKELVEPKRQKGPHAAVGTIDYGGGNKGVLLYIKSSLSGDENDYIRAYARRYNDFPHENTGDQFFSEEQFEVYRALGFHMMHGALNGDHVVEAVGSDKPVNFRKSPNAAVKTVREALL
jgi:hypothetical protein